MILGLTGGSGTGKSSACRFFEEKGFLIIDMDKVSRKVCQKGEKCLDEIVSFFGSGILDENGELIRKKLGDIVFSDKEKLAILNKITHKYIIRDALCTIRQNPGRDVVLDAAVLFESGAHTLCTHTICILADFEKRLSRIMARDSLLEESARNRIMSQPNDDFYIARCDAAVYNNDGPDALYEELENWLGEVYGK